MMKRWIFLNTEKNLMRKRAVERNLEIIGEAINRILKTDSSYTEITDATAIVGLRNQVIHAYDISDKPFGLYLLITCQN
jgi:uncharacterized protein with HEPN domain